MGIFKQVLNLNLPEVYSNLENLKIHPELYLIEWIMTIFSKNLNIDVAARIWDLYMIEGIKTIFQASISILNLSKKILASGSFDECLICLKGNNNNLFSISQESLIETMKNVKFSDLILFELEKLNDEYIPLYKN